jgi:tetratricopeptide (TPR) repeat protein
LNRGNVFAKQGLYNEAISDYSKVIEIDSSHAGAYNNRAIARKNIGEHGKAAEDFKVACELGVKQACLEYGKIGL